MGGTQNVVGLNATKATSYTKIIDPSVKTISARYGAYTEFKGENSGLRAYYDAETNTTYLVYSGVSREEFESYRDYYFSRGVNQELVNNAVSYAYLNNGEVVYHYGGSTNTFKAELEDNILVVNPIDGTNIYNDIMGVKRINVTAKVPDRENNPILDGEGNEIKNVTVKNCVLEKRPDGKTQDIFVKNVKGLVLENIQFK